MSEDGDRPTDPYWWATWVRITPGARRMEKLGMLSVLRAALAREMAHAGAFSPVTEFHPDEEEVDTAFERLLLAVFPPDGRDK